MLRVNLIYENRKLFIRNATWSTGNKILKTLFFKEFPRHDLVLVKQAQIIHSGL